jgi:hypothetical protein
LTYYSVLEAVRHVRRVHADSERGREPEVQQRNQEPLVRPYVMTSRKGRDQKTIENALPFPFIKAAGRNSYGTKGTFELVDSATFATLAAFRNFVVKGDDGTYEWKGGFSAVETAWRKLGAELVMTCQDTAETLPAHKMAVLLGRNRPLWNGLHKTVKEYLTRQDAEEKTAELQAEIDRLRKLADGQPTPA